MVQKDNVEHYCVENLQTLKGIIKQFKDQGLKVVYDRND